MTIEEIRKGVLRRRERREFGLFIDGTGLDRATRRLKKRVDMPKFIRGVTAGAVPVVARYYTLIPYEDDSRQHSFLDALRRAGLRIVVKRLPPKGVQRQVSVDVEMAADIIAFGLGKSEFSVLSEYVTPELSKNAPQRPLSLKVRQQIPAANAKNSAPPAKEEPNVAEKQEPSGPVQRVVTVVCPSRDLSYPIALIKELGVDTITADFGQFNNKDVLKSAAKWIDLSDSETIWKED